LSLHGWAVIKRKSLVNRFIKATKSARRVMATARGDAAAERTKASDVTKDGRAELARLIAERAALTYTAATDNTVAAAREAVVAAERIRAAGCSKRGPQCRAREAEEAAARAALVKAIGDKAATDRAAKLESNAAAVRARLANSAPIAGTADPGAAALASYLTTFGVAIPAGVVSEWLVLVGVIALELGSALSIVFVRSVSGGHRSAPSTGRALQVPAAPAHTKAVDRQEPAPVPVCPSAHGTPRQAQNQPFPGHPGSG
jgi:hypothetical protein